MQNAKPPSNTLKGDSPPPPQFARHGAHTKPPQTFHHPNTEPPRNRLNRDSLPRPTDKTPSHHVTHQNATALPRHSSLGTGRTRSPRASAATPAGPQRTPNTDARRGAYILCRDIRVSELCEDGSPAGAKRIYAPRTTNPHYSGNAKIPPIPKNQRDFL